MIDARDLGDMLDMVGDLAERDLRRGMRRLPLGQRGRRLVRLADVEAAEGRRVEPRLLGGRSAAQRR